MPLHKAAGVFGLLLAPEMRAWRGEQPQWTVFWLYGVAATCAIAALYFDAMVSGRTALRQLLLLVLAGYTGWIVVSVWRCADNTREPLWGTLARFLTIAWAANGYWLSRFLELDLLGTLIGELTEEPRVRCGNDISIWAGGTVAIRAAHRRDRPRSPCCCGCA